VVHYSRKVVIKMEQLKNKFQTFVYLLYIAYTLFILKRLWMNKKSIKQGTNIGN
jgi:hypothetical protein